MTRLILFQLRIMPPRSHPQDPPADQVFLLVGRNGQVGAELLSRLPALGRVVAPGRDELDLAHRDAIARAVESIRPTVIVNAAAYTAVDAAESDRERCLRINAEAPGDLARAAAGCGAALVHYSTNYVFDGAASGPYREEDAAAPLGVYGESKLQGERAVAAALPAHVVLRTSAVYGWNGTNFMRRMLELAHERDELRVVDDQLVSPTPAASIAAATVEMLRRLPGTGVAAHGTFHLTTTGAVTWLGFARAILQRDPARAQQRCRALVPLTTAEYPTPARRPLNGVLATERFTRQFGFALGHWETELDGVFARRPLRAEDAR